MSAKQIIRVLDAIKDEGCATSQEISDFTGLPVAKISTNLAQLRKLGFIKVTHRAKTASDRRGPRSNWYVPA